MKHEANQSAQHLPSIMPLHGGTHTLFTEVSTVAILLPPRTHLLHQAAECLQDILGVRLNVVGVGVDHDSDVLILKSYPLHQKLPVGGRQPTHVLMWQAASPET